ncbi:MAG TPA: hypothetical protein VFV67_33695 [Actinophytocola sp.]|uniref:hypothetical protein n=1 Tax=Actinophytocola sp. TaxID=1872138 RepID=UPI002DBA9891|nr:hypothetical protein [Actinophytocola sp.]HEU5475623.1 hypothetical protein [Actinophytocola sp.]
MADSDKWGEISDAVQAASRTADGLTLGPARLGYAAEARGVVDAYDGLRQKFTTLLAGAATEFDKVAATLVDVATTYLREDEENAHALKRLEEHL